MATHHLLRSGRAAPGPRTCSQRCARGLSAALARLAAAAARHGHSSSSSRRSGPAPLRAESASSSQSPVANALEQHNAAVTNPLEQLRATKDVKRRTELLRELDTTWSDWEERYVPTPAEAALAQELGLGASTVMLVAVQNPGLADLDAASQVLPSLRALRGAGVAPQDAWFLVSRRWQLLAEPAGLSRWLDFISVYGMKPRDCQNFLLKAPPQLLSHVTLYQAGQVVTFLKSLGLTDDLLAARVLCVWPAVLGRDVDSQLRPVVSYLMSLGLEVGAVGRVVAMWPDVLVQSVEWQLAPWVDYLRGLGCSTAQVGDVVCACPHLLGFPPEDVFGGVLRCLAELGLGREAVAGMVGRSLAFLVAPSASAGVRAAVECLAASGFSAEEVRHMVAARPELLAAKPHDLSRSLEFVYGTVGGSRATVLACPLLLARPLGQVLGPRYSFVQKQGLAHRYTGDDGSTFEFYKLLVAEDDEWCASLGLSVNEYQGFKLVWDEEYSLRLHQEAATEFQAELKKLGIYEGS